MSLLDNLPLGTLISIAGIVLAILGYLGDDLTYLEALAGVGVTSGGGGLIGTARAQSGKGIRR